MRSATTESEDSQLDLLRSLCAIETPITSQDSSGFDAVRPATSLANTIAAAGGPVDSKPVAATRDRLTVDLRGLGTRLHAQAASQQMTAAAFVRSAVSALLHNSPRDDANSKLVDCAGDITAVKVTVRLPASHAFLLARRARQANVSQGAYLASLIGGTPAEPPAPDHARAVTALMSSTDRLAVLGADLNAFMRLLGHADQSELEPYRASMKSLVADVRAHLASAAALMAALKPARGRR